MLALILMYISLKYFGTNVWRIIVFARVCYGTSWSWAKFKDMLEHIWVPMVVIGTSGTAGLIRVFWNNLLDELSKLYVVAARSKGDQYYSFII